MTDIYFEGPDVPRLFSDIGVNTFRNFGRNRAKQFVACNHDGYVIGDGILFGLEEDKFNLVGRPSAPNWAAFVAETGGYDVTVTRDVRSLDNNNTRLTFRYQVQGPAAMDIIEKAHGGSLPEVKPFRMHEFAIAGARSGDCATQCPASPGSSCTDLPPTARGAGRAVRGGRGVRAGAGRGSAYSSTATESGWIASPTPAIYSGER